MHHRHQTMNRHPEPARQHLALAALLALGALMALMATPAMAFRGHEFSFTFGAEGSGAGQFSEPSGVAVNDATGQVYVLDQGNSRIERFSAAGIFEAQFDGSETPAKAFAFGSEALNGGIAVDNSCHFKKLSGSACTSADPSNGDVYVTDPEHEVVDKFSPEGVYLGQLEQTSGGEAFTFEGVFMGGFGEGGPAGVAVDTSGAVWADAGPRVVGDVYRFTNAEPSTFVSPPTHLENAIGGGGILSFGFAVDSEDNVYTRDVGSSVNKFQGSGNPAEALALPFAPGETSAVAVDLASEEVFLDNVSSVGAFDSSGVEQERFGAGHLSGGSGLAVNHETASNSTVYVADAAAGVVAVFPPEPPGAPLLVGESVAKVTANSANLEAEVNPRGASTEYHFEYGACATPSTCVGSPYEKTIPIPDVVAGSDFEVHSVSANPQDLLAGTVYHFRVIAHNGLGEVPGLDQTFTTQPAGVFELPDARAWEMVSPLDKHGALIEAIGEAGMVQAAAGGDAITYLADAPTEAGPQGNANGVQVLSTRGGAGTPAWSSRDIAIPHDMATRISIGNGSEYRFFSSDLSLAVVQPFGAFTPSLSDAASEQTAFLRTNYPHGNVNEPCLESCYAPLVTGCPVEGEECRPSVAEHANVEPGTVFGEEGHCPSLNLLCGPQFRGATPDLGHVVLNSGASLTSTSVKEGLYEWSGGAIALLSVLPKGEGGSAVGGRFGGSVQLSADFRHAISDDGLRVVWTSNASEPHLYLYDSSKEGSTRLDPTTVKGTPEFQSANADVSEVFFTENGDLYEYDVEHDELRRLTEGAEVRFSLPALSEDGAYLYFVANGVLAEGAKPGQCTEEPLPNATCNLYELHNGAVALVAVLSGADNADWNRNLAHLTARSSPDGHWLAFMSQRSLTGYDNRDAISGQRDEEVYLYDATRPTGAGNPVCVSCDPSGARPLGVEYNHQWLAANIPGWTAYATGKALYQSRYLSNSGRLFFNSNEALVPQDVNGTWDVYEYEPPSVGGCSSSSSTFGEHSGGCVAMLSSGASPEESAFLDASENGDDVFFLTAGKLSRQDNDTSLDVYDARVCSAQSPCIEEPQTQPPPCSTEASCRPAPSPQPEIFGFPASATFSGIGNITSLPLASVRPRSAAEIKAEKLARALKACRKKPKKKRPACGKQARRTYGPPGKTKKSNRRAG